MNFAGSQRTPEGDARTAGAGRPQSGTLPRLRRHFAGYRRALGALGALSMASALFEAASLAALVPLVAAVADPDHVVDVDLGRRFGIVTLGAEALFVACASAVAGRTLVQLLVALLDARTSGLYAARTRNELLAAFLSASWERQAAERSGNLQMLLTENVSHGLTCLRSLVQIVVAACNFAVLLAMALFVDVVAAALLLGVAAALFLIVRPLSEFARRNAKEKTALNTSFASIIHQVVALAREIRIYGATDAVRTSLRDVVERVRRSRGAALLASTALPIVYQNGAACIVLGGLLWVYVSNSAEIASLAASALLLVRAFSYTQSMQVAQHQIVEAMPFLAQLDEARSAYAGSADAAGTVRLKALERIRFEAVGFDYAPGSTALSDVSFAVAAGEAVGIVGPSGSGKSTLIQLLLRLRRPTAGRLLVNERPADELAAADWFGKLGFVPQEPQLLTTTVAENIRFYRPQIDEPAIVAAARQAGVHDEIMRMEQGYETPVGERGSRLSGGQRQRICIARALAADPQVMIFDEPTSALDVHSEARIQESLARLKGRVTLFIVAHRLSTLNICDKVMVLRDGRLRSFGPQEELAATDEYYGEALRLSQVR